MARLQVLPEWVDLPLSVVACAESAVLSFFDATRAPQALGSWISLAWLGSEQNQPATGPFGREWPTEQAAWAAMLMAGPIADGEPYPALAWWAARGISRTARMSQPEWAKRTDSGWERHYARGVAVALGWVTGELPEPQAMVPLLDGAAEPIPASDRARYRSELQRVGSLVEARSPGEPSTGGANI
ncbi:MAG: hypothetical protein ABS81_04240 [Pseudonocardia sp. SCN 72-86]|nr:MAG: hypothetical protein ABS81_04240 [Pseudonocardia sp. SCN 72-86]